MSGSTFLRQNYSLDLRAHATCYFSSPRADDTRKGVLHSDVPTVGPVVLWRFTWMVELATSNSIVTILSEKLGHTKGLESEVREPGPKQCASSTYVANLGDEGRISH